MTALALTPFHARLELANIAMVFLLVVALTTAHLATALRREARHAARRATETRSLYELARDLAGAISLEQVAAVAERYLQGIGHAHAILLVADASGALAPATASRKPPDYLEMRLAERAFRSAEMIGSPALADAGQAVLYLPLRAPVRVRGTLAVRVDSGARDAVRMATPLLDAVALLIAVVVERLHYVEVARQAELEMASERLRNSLLSAMSHDVRTPLTALVGLADTLVLTRPLLPPAARESAEAIREQARRLNGMVGNILDMARLQAGHVRLRKEWQLVQEVVGAALKLIEGALASRTVVVDVAEDVPLVEFDALMIERVICNLVENAAKYSPAGAPISIRARREGDFVTVAVIDRGYGFPPGREEALFGMFARGQVESSISGTGLGLAIARTIVEAHGGRINATHAAGGGAEVAFTLPLGVPPAVPDEADAGASGATP